MLLEFSIIPLGVGTHLNSELAHPRHRGRFRAAVPAHANRHGRGGRMGRGDGTRASLPPGDADAFAARHHDHQGPYRGERAFLKKDVW